MHLQGKNVKWTKHITALVQVHTHVRVTHMSIARDTTMTAGPHCKLAHARIKSMRACTLVQPRKRVFKRANCQMRTEDGTRTLTVHTRSSLLR